VRKEAAEFVRLKLDLTQSDPQSEAARAIERFDIRGVPTILFLDSTGRERADLRLEGFEKPAAFVNRMRQIANVQANKTEAE
jgi:thiol:disulfide interchange protein DsbD